MPPSHPKTYYQDRIDKYWTRLGMMLRSSQKLLAKDVGEPVEVRAETRANFERLLVELPDIGGDRNLLTSTFVLSAGALAYLQALEQRGLEVRTIGENLVRTYGNVYGGLPAPLRWWLRQTEFSARHRDQLKAFAKFSQRREYPANWVMEYVEGDGRQFDFGCDYLECAVWKLVQSLGMERYMPYLCMADFAASEALGTGLQRTTSLFCGGGRCDFRFKKNRPAYSPLPFEHLPEFQPKNSS